MFYIRHFHFARVAVSTDRGGRLRAPNSSVRKGPVFVHAHCTDGVTGSKGRGEANGVEGGIGVGGGIRDGNGLGGGNWDVNGGGNGDGVGAGTGTGVEENEGT